MSILSLDIGVHNLGYAVLNVDENTLVYDVFDIDEHVKRHYNCVIARTIVVRDFIKDLFTKYSNINKVIIERQVASNIVAMEIMYLLTATVINYCEDIVIFDPKLKFTILKVPFSTASKSHKKLSIAMVDNILSKFFDATKFNMYKKKDDISDAILQLLVEHYKDNKEKLTEIRNCAFLKNM